eukprot:10420258-Heterocapsa_arctica.AAC.1
MDVPSRVGDPLRPQQLCDALREVVALPAGRVQEDRAAYVVYVRGRRLAGGHWHCWGSWPGARGTGVQGAGLA